MKKPKKVRDPNKGPISRIEQLIAHLAAGGSCILLEPGKWVDYVTNRPISSRVVRIGVQGERLVASQHNPLTGDPAAYAVNPEWRPPPPKATRRKRAGIDLGPAPG